MNHNTNRTRPLVIRKQPTFCDVTSAFPAKRRVTTQIREVLLIGRPTMKIASTNQKNYPDLGSDVTDQN